MASLSSVQQRGNPLSQMNELAGVSLAVSMGDPTRLPDVVFNSMRVINNQRKTSSQIINFSASEMMSKQSRTELRGNVPGYSDTLG